MYMSCHVHVHVHVRDVDSFRNVHVKLTTKIGNILSKSQRVELHVQVHIVSLSVAHLLL